MTKPELSEVLLHDAKTALMYEELRAAIDDGHESMTHADALAEIAAMRAENIELRAKLASIGAGGVQALSAAPAGVSVLSPTEQKWVLQSPGAIAQLLTFIDIDFSQGESVGMDMGKWPPKRYTELKNIGRKIVEQDPDCFDAELLSTFGAASPTPPAEQQATTTEAVTPKAGATTGAALGDVYAELLEPDATTYGLGAVWNRHSMRDFADRTHALRMQQVALKAAPMSPINRLIAYSAATKLRELGFNWDDESEAWVNTAAPQQEAQEPVALLVRKNSWRAGQWEAAPPDSPSYGLAWANQRQYVYAAPQPAPAELEQLRERISKMGLDVDRAMRGHVNEQSPLGTQRLAAIAALAALAKPAPRPLSEREDIAMVDAAMVEMANIVPPLKRSECARLIRAALAAQGGKDA